jgi:hypothetical protein
MLNESFTLDGSAQPSDRVSSNDYLWKYGKKPTSIKRRADFLVTPNFRTALFLTTLEGYSYARFVFQTDFLVTPI